MMVIKAMMVMMVIICLDTLFSDTSDPTDLNTKKAICFVICFIPFSHLDHDPLDAG